MSHYRDDYQAALSRATALEMEIEQLKRQQQYHQATITALSRELRARRLEVRELAEIINQSPIRAEDKPARASNTVVVFALAVLSLLVVHPLGPLAWIAANRELRLINMGFSDPRHRPMAVAGKVLGITATIIFIVTTLMFLFASAGAPCGHEIPWHAAY